MTFISHSAKLAVIAAIAVATMLAAPTRSQAASINFSSIETVLSDPDNMDDKMLALWTGWLTQLYEYNQPFLQITSDPGDSAPVTEVRLSIGDTNFRFDNEFLGKDMTNAAHIPADGRYALPGSSNPGLVYNSFIDDGGDELVIQFPNGLGPDDMAIVQFDISPDDPADKVNRFASYSAVLFNVNPGDDNTGNSIVTVEFGNGLSSSVQLPNLDLDPDMVPSISAPRPYANMQTNTPLIPLDITDPIPEPTAGCLILAGLALASARRRV